MVDEVQEEQLHLVVVDEVVDDFHCDRELQRDSVFLLSGHLLVRKKVWVH